MHSFFTLSLVVLFNTLAHTQVKSDTIDFLNPSWHLQLNDDISQMDSLLLPTINFPSMHQFGGAPLQSINGISNSIETNGYRDVNGVLYTMKIVVPKDNSAALREYKWIHSLDSIDQQIIFPPVKKK